MVIAERSSIDTIAQAKIQHLLDELTSSGMETGVQVAAYHNGVPIIDAWSGYMDEQKSRPVEHDTLFLTFSCSKGVTATVIHQLVEAGKLDYDTPIAHYWPEFAANGKEGVTVRHALKHEAGIPKMPNGITPEKLGDFRWMVKQVEQMKPIWKPGTRTAYHGATFGVILGELAQRVTGRLFAQIVQENICAPLGIDDLFFGLPPTLSNRVATLGGQRVPWRFMPPFFLIKRVMPMAVEPGKIWNHPALQQGVIPAANMITTARSLARHYAALLPGGVDGVCLLPPERVKIASALATDGSDPVFFGGHVRKGLGYWLGGDKDSPYGTRTNVFGHTGSGGMIAFADPDYRFSFAVVKNQSTWRFGEDTDLKVANAVREALGIPN